MTITVVKCFLSKAEGRRFSNLWRNKLTSTDVLEDVYHHFFFKKCHNILNEVVLMLCLNAVSKMDDRIIKQEYLFNKQLYDNKIYCKNIVLNNYMIFTAYFSSQRIKSNKMQHFYLFSH